MFMHVTKTRRLKMNEFGKYDSLIYRTKLLTLTEDPYGSLDIDCRHYFRAHAIDSDDNEYLISWDTERNCDNEIVVDWDEYSIRILH